MGNKATEDIISTVRSIVGGEFSDMDIIRALHMANNDPTGAINIIFDTPRSFKKLLHSNSNGRPGAEAPVIASCVKEDVSVVDGSSPGLKCNGSLENIVGSENLGSGVVKELGDEWWFVASCEISGLSTCKGRVLKPGDEVNFTFPVEKKLTTPSPGKLGGGRGRQVATCSEIVRFSTKSCGEVLRVVLSNFGTALPCYLIGSVTLFIVFIWFR